MKLDSIGQDTLTRLGVCVVVSVALLYGAEALLDRMGPVSFVVDTRRPNRLAKKKPLRREGNRRSSYDE